MEKLNLEERSDIRNYLATFHKEFEDEEVEETESINDQDSDEECSPEDLYGYISNSELNEEINIKEEPDDESEIIEQLNAASVYYPDVKLIAEQSPKRKGVEIIRLGSLASSNKISETIKTEEYDKFDEDPTVISAMGEDLHVNDQRALEMVAQFAEQAVANASKTTDLNGADNGGAYQTVTIVPSDTNPGELSYVLFVSENGDCMDNDVIGESLPLFNLSDTSEFSEAFFSEQLKKDGVKMRTIRFGARKASLATQVYTCNNCDYSSPKRYLLSRHMKCHSEERPHKCGVCERGFKTLASLQNHVNTHTGTRPHSCKECESCFTTSGELVRHIRYKHTHEKPHKCTECDYASVELSKLKRHMRCHTGERPYQCPHCTYASPDTYKLKRHLRIHTGEKPYECDVCQSRFTQSNSLKAHKLIHSGKKPIFNCEYCPATCGRKTDLRIHMEKLHSVDKPHNCRRCGKVFLDRYSYKIHLRSHEGEKCFKCDLCNYASVSQRHLETHMYVHTDQKPFRCDDCEQSFRQKQLLKRHRNLYHNPNYIRPIPKEKNHVCAVCSKAFRHKGNLIRHFVTHDPEALLDEKDISLHLEESKDFEDEVDGDVDGINTDSMKSDAQSQQVVVFEVIQLPGANKIACDPQTATVVDGQTFFLNGSKNQTFSVIQKAEEVNDLLTLSHSGVTDRIGNEENLSSTKKQKNVARQSVLSRNTKKYTRENIKKVNLLRISAAKSIPENPNLPTISTVHIKSHLEDVKLLESENELQVGRDFENCFGFGEENGDLLSASINSTFGTFESNNENDIS